MVKLLLDAGVGVDPLDSDGETPLFHAIKKDNEDIVELLLEAKADANFLHFKAGTPLMVASFYGNERIIELLIAAGANINYQDSRGTPLCMATRYRKEGAVRVLIEAKAEVNLGKRDEAGLGYGADETPLKYAAKNGDERIVTLLLNAGADVGDSLLHILYTLKDYSGHRGTISLLIAKTVDLNSMFNNQTAVEIAIEHKDKTLLKALIKIPAASYGVLDVIPQLHLKLARFLLM